jgi:hypothetical protein
MADKSKPSDSKNKQKPREPKGNPKPEQPESNRKPMESKSTQKPKETESNQKPKPSQKRLSPAIIVAMIGALTTIVVTLINVFPEIIKQNNTPTSVQVTAATCRYSSSFNDNEAIVWIIEQEAVAVTSKDIDLINAIFAEKAIIVDAASQGGNPTQWNNPINRYQPLFKDYDFIDAENTNIRATGPINNNTVEYTSGSNGTYIVNGQTNSYTNPDNASRWTVTKINGCWKITRFVFNSK